ncbi:MAG: hypothetical protein H6631_20525 [Anaerolineaceae bacterium]|nr:hypothetical protein [Anaerolineaceae bacterium]
MNRTLIIIGGFIALALLAGGAFMAARLLSAGDSAASGGPGNINIVAEDGGGGAFAMSLDIKAAPELPPTPPETGGVFVRREDNSIFVGTGEIEVMAEAENDGPPALNVNFSGPVLEVVVTRETTIYRDETEFPTPSQASSGEQTVQQVVAEVDSLNELGPNTKNAELQVWGNRSGDRVVAQVVVYRMFE